jgi:protein SCO1/2
MPSVVRFHPWLVVVAAMLVLVVMTGGCKKSPPPFRGTAVQDVVWGRDFVLTDQTGKPFDTRSLHGKIQVVFFGFTHCPDICAPTLTKLAQATKQLGPDASQVQVLFVTVDPAHDTPAQLRKFLAGIDPAFVGLTGTAAQVQAVAGSHMSYFHKDAGQGAQIVHTGTVFVKDRHGRMRLILKETASVEDLVHDLQLVSRE